DEVTKLGNIDLIADNNEKSRIYEFLHVDQSHFVLNQENNHLLFDEMSITQMVEHTRAFIKVQDGCDFYCAYCAVAYARGPSRSRDRERILQQIRLLVEHDYQEFVLGGINLGLYGKEKQDNYFLADLLRDIELIDGVELIRLSSLEPQLFSDDLFRFLAASRKTCHHFHIPLQTGSDTLLSQMGRHYSTAEFVETIGKIKQIYPDCAIGIDVIVGLPGETDALFQETYDFLQALDFTYLHVFSYSVRPGTRAEKMPGQINGKIKNLRSNELIKLSHRKTADYISRIVANGTELRGVIETCEDGFCTALSDHYIRIYLPEDNSLQKKYLHFLPVKKRFDGVEVERRRSVEADK
nr:MiaB/RimO family radical SAM methylthiotransferase [Candidatus Cloacimonadota bacterium]